MSSPALPRRDRRRPQVRPPARGLGTELEMQDAAPVHLDRAQMCRIHSSPVEGRALHVLDRWWVLDAVGADRHLAVAARLDDELAVTDANRRAGEGRCVDEEQILPGYREEAWGVPAVPGG